MSNTKKGAEVKPEAPTKKAPEKMVRMEMLFKGKVSYIDVPESQVKAHKEAGWK